MGISNQVNGTQPGGGILRYMYFYTPIAAINAAWRGYFDVCNVSSSHDLCGFSFV
jgi:hypothetical protein